MSEAPYTVRGARVNVVRVFRLHGHRFHLHRPVERDGQRRRQGWQLTHEGVPMVALVDCSQDEAVREVERVLHKGVSKVALATAIMDTRSADRRGEDLSPRWPS
jgi:hypothetical protein